MSFTRTLLVAASLSLLMGCPSEMAEPPKGPAPGTGTKALTTAKAADHKVEAPKGPASPTVMTPQPAPDGWTRFSRGKMAGEVKSVPLAELLARSKELQGQTLRVKAEVEASCPGGCWALMGQKIEHGPLRVRCQARAIKLPPDAPGAVVEAQGVLKLRTVPLERAIHLEEERARAIGEKPRTITEPPVEITLDATGWVLTRTEEQAKKGAAKTKEHPDSHHAKPTKPQGEHGRQP